MSEDARPEILPVDQESEILYDRLCDALERDLSLTLQPDVNVRNDAAMIAGMAVTGVLRKLRVMSARQLAVVLAEVANRGVGYVIHEPPRYTPDEIEGIL